MFPCVYLVQRTLLYLVSSGAVVIDKTFPGYQHRILDNTFHINLHLSIFQGHNVLGFFRIGRDIEIRSQNADVIVTGMYIKRFTIFMLHIEYRFSLQLYTACFPPPPMNRSVWNKRSATP